MPRWQRLLPDLLVVLLIAVLVKELQLSIHGHCEMGNGRGGEGSIGVGLLIFVYKVHLCSSHGYILAVYRNCICIQ